MKGEEVDDWYASYVVLAEDDFEQTGRFHLHQRKAGADAARRDHPYGPSARNLSPGNVGAVLQLKGLMSSRDAIADFLRAAA